MISNIISILHPVLDIIDNLMPGLIGYQEGINTKSLKWFYCIFTLLYLSYIYFYLGKTQEESSIYVKFGALLLNISLLIYHNKTPENNKDCSSRFN